MVVAPSRRRQKAAPPCTTGMAQEQQPGGVHGVDVERLRPRDDVSAGERVEPRGAVLQAVGVPTFERRESGVEAGRRLGDGPHGHVGGQEPAQPTSELVGLHRVVEVDVRDLSAGVHAGVGTPRAGECGARPEAQDGADRLLHGLLHSAQPGLRRPPAEPGSVVGKIESQPHAATVVPTVVP